jgi:hypothetical protein
MLYKLFLPYTTLCLAGSASLWATVVNARSGNMGLMPDSNLANLNNDYVAFLLSHYYRL